MRASGFRTFVVVLVVRRLNRVIACVLCGLNALNSPRGIRECAADLGGYLLSRGCRVAVGVPICPRFPSLTALKPVTYGLADPFAYPMTSVGAQSVVTSQITAGDRLPKPKRSCRDEVFTRGTAVLAGNLQN